MASESDTHSRVLLSEDTRAKTMRPKSSHYYKRPSVYDAVAGRISSSGFISKQVSIPYSRDTTSSSRTVLAPEQVLFRSKNAPTRYAEHDIYFANEKNDVSDLPNSDLLKALHTYAADFYSKATIDKGITDWKSLDGTALIALGILTEELILDMIGETGDLALTEGEKCVMAQNRQVNTKSTSPFRPAKKRRKIDVVTYE